LSELQSGHVTELLNELLTDKVAVVTGSAAGIGRGLAVAFAQQGASVAGLDIDSAGNAESARLVAATGQQGLFLDCDVADANAVEQTIGQVAQRFGRIDLLVNNTAIWSDDSLTGGSYRQQTQSFSRAMAVCALASHYCACAAVPHMSRGANIINLITEHIKEGHYITGAPATGYDCAKFSQWRLTETWAAELAQRGIRVNALCFGATDTPMLRGVNEEMADLGMKPGDLGQAVLNVVAHGEQRPTGESYLFGTTGTPREESLEQIAALAPASAA
jgi:NAD(P)-dependent dehydrogenase (short-subunit alcohol dehydrogenase family)